MKVSNIPSNFAIVFEEKKKNMNLEEEIFLFQMMYCWPNDRDVSIKRSIVFSTRLLLILWMSLFLSIVFLKVKVVFLVRLSSTYRRIHEKTKAE